MAALALIGIASLLLAMHVAPVRPAGGDDIQDGLSLADKTEHGGGGRGHHEGNQQNIVGKYPTRSRC